MVREHATYNCPCGKHDVLKSKPQIYIVWPWDLLIVIANVNLIGNWKRLNYIGISVGIIGNCGNNIFSPRNLKLKMMALKTFFINFLMTNHVPLHNRGGFKLRINITEDPIFSCKLCGGMPGKSNKFNNSVR
jgi:hypothetical protein